MKTSVMKAIALILSADADKLARVFDNLFRNAVNYSESDTQIICSARKGNGCILITISNQGLQVSQEKLSRIFDKFYRVAFLQRDFV